MKKIILVLVLLFSLTGCLIQKKYDPVSDAINKIKIDKEVTNDFSIPLVIDNVEFKWTSNSNAIVIDNNNAIVNQTKLDQNVELKVVATKNEDSKNKTFKVKVLKDDNYPDIVSISESYSLSDNSYVKYLDVTVQDSSNLGTIFTDGLNSIFTSSVKNLELGSYEVVGKKITNNIPTLEDVKVTKIVSSSKVLNPILNPTSIKKENGYYTITGTVNILDNKVYIKNSNLELEVISNELSLFDKEVVTINAYVLDSNKIISFTTGNEMNVSDDKLLDIIANNLNVVTYTKNNINLLNNSLFNSTITWSSNNSAISNTGVVTRGQSNINAELSATIKLNNKQIVKKFEVVVIDVNNNYLDDLFISEYYEGLSYNKYIEIYNPTDLVINLDEYSILLATDGGEFTNNDSNKYNLSGELLPGESFIVYHNSFNKDLVNEITKYKSMTSTQTNFNGNDCIGLFKEDELIDIFGFDKEPTNKYWEVVGGNTVDHRIIRNKTVGASPIWNSNDWTATKITSELPRLDNLGIHSFV